MPKNLKFLLIFFLVLAPTFFPSTRIFSQSALEQAEQDYVFQFSKYRDNQEEYLDTKARYEQFKTATSKNEAYLKTKEYLIQTANLYDAYILYTKEAGNKVNWKDSQSDRLSTTKLLDEETDYLVSIRQEIENVRILEEFSPVAEEFHQRIKTQTEPKLYKVLAIYELTEAKETLKSMNTTTQAVENYISQTEVQETTTISNWRSGVENLKNKSEQEIAAAQEIMAKTKEGVATRGQFSQIAKNSENVDENLRQSQKLFEEILRII